MVWQRVRLALLAGVVAASAALSARADDCCAPASSAPACAPQPSVCTRTAYRTEYKQETYTAYRCESVPETRTYTCTVYKRVPEVRTVTCTKCVCVPVVEERTVMQTCVTCKPVTHMTSRCVDRGHWECCEVPCKKSHRLSGCLHRLCHRKSCCDSCAEPCCPPPTKTVRKWVPCKVWEQVPVTRMERVCESRPVKCHVTTYKREMREEKVQVTCWKCVPETRTQTCQVMVTRRVPYQATRTVAVCVPCQETVACCQATTCCKPRCCRSHARCCHREKCRSGCFHRCGGHRGCHAKTSCCD
jgi:hypothetical protein